MIELKSYSVLGEISPILLVVIALWLMGLSLAFWWLFNHYKKLTRGVAEGNLIKVLEKILRVGRKNEKEIRKLGRDLGSLGKKARPHIQKVGLTRFNPFDETGGDQSFSLCLLDENNKGFVLTALHTRDRTRVYAKPIEDGRSKYKLSSEEKNAIDRAKRRK